jgi:hypothetical protein
MQRRSRRELCGPLTPLKVPIGVDHLHVGGVDLRQLLGLLRVDGGEIALCSPSPTASGGVAGAAASRMRARAASAFFMFVSS